MQAGRGRRRGVPRRGLGKRDGGDCDDVVHDDVQYIDARRDSAFRNLAHRILVSFATPTHGATSGTTHAWTNVCARRPGGLLYVAKDRPRVYIKLILITHSNGNISAVMVANNLVARRDQL